MIKFESFQGMVTKIANFPIGENTEGADCYKLISLVDSHGTLINFVIEPTTYFVNHIMMVLGDTATGFYDANAAVPMIFPPQFRAIVMARETGYQNVKVEYFNSQLVSSDNTLRLNIAPCTQIILENSQAFTNNPGNRNLIVIYGATTRSIPAQTTPYKIIVMC